MIYKKLIIYNLVAVLEGVMLIVISVFLWFLSYDLVYDWTLSFNLFWAKFVHQRVPEYIPELIATVFIIILALEATAKGVRKYGNHTLRDSWFKAEIAPVTTSAYLIRRDSNFYSALAYLISQLIMSAPRLLVEGFSCLTKVLTMSSTEILQGQILMNNLEHGEAWQDFSEFEHLELVIRKLLKLKLILIRERNSCLKIRLSRDLRK